MSPGLPHKENCYSLALLPLLRREAIKSGKLLFLGPKPFLLGG